METEEKIKRIKRLTEQMEAGIQQVFQSDRYKDYLATMARMPQYSFANTMLIYMNNPEATIVTTYDKMREDYGYQVKWAEKSFCLMQPNKYRKSVESAVKEIDRGIARSKIANIGRYYFGKEEAGNYRIESAEGQVIEKNMEKRELREFIREKVIDKEFSYPPFLAYPVFDISQATPIVIGQNEKGEDILDPKAARLQLSPVDEIPDFEDDAVLKKYFEAAARTADMPITYRAPIGKESGYINKDGINITPSITKTHALKTLIHEIAHGRLHLNTQNKVEKGQKEVEAESIAFITCQYFGIDTSNYSFGYVATWSDGQDLHTLKASLDTIRRESNRMIRDMELQLSRLQDIEKEALHLKNPIFQDEQSANLTFYAAEFGWCHMAGRYRDGMVSREEAVALYKEYYRTDNSDPAVGVVYQDKKIQLFPPKKEEIIYLDEIIEDLEYFGNYLGDMTRSDEYKDKAKEFSARNVQINIYQPKENIKDNIQSQLHMKSYDSLHSAMIRVRKAEYDLAASIPMKEVQNISGLPDLVIKVGSKLPETGDVVEIVNERKCSFFYYVEANTIQEFANFGREIPQDEAIRRFADLYRINPVLAITDAGFGKDLGRELPLAKLARSVRDKAEIISKLDQRILPLPDNEESLTTYLEKGAMYADNIYKQQREDVVLQVIWSELPEFAAEKVYTLKQAVVSYAAIKDKCQEKARTAEMTVFIKTGKDKKQKALELTTCNIRVSDVFPTFLNAIQKALQPGQKEDKILKAIELQMSKDKSRNKESIAKSR